eukprot:10608195-Ditylum_brightwellii.AAC.1
MLGEYIRMYGNRQSNTHWPAPPGWKENHKEIWGISDGSFLHRAGIPLYQIPDWAPTGELTNRPTLYGAVKPGPTCQWQCAAIPARSYKQQR